MSFADSRSEKAMSFRPIAMAFFAAALLACARSSEPSAPAAGGGTGTVGSSSAPGVSAAAPAGASSSADPLPPHEGPWSRGEGTQRMAERLRLLNEAAQPGVNPFLNAERAAQISRALPRIPDPLERMKAMTHMADELLRAGRIQEAIDTVTPLLTPSPADAPYAPPLDETREFIGLCYLRLGETENCIQSHTLESCLLPIRGGGLHTKKEGSRRAMEYFEKVLRDRPDDLGTMWLYNLAAMTLGLYPDQVPPALRVPPAIFQSEGDIGRFTDVAPAAGLDVRQHAGGAVMDDFDGDGLLDIVVTSMGLNDPIRFFHNRGDGRFEERSEAAGLTGLVGGLNVIHADYDNDGDLDLFVLRGGWMQKGG
ncbi:MAG TPA: VCBS repeat-containing protein, partial [Candidatus Polarisedimenticolia bacterium]|nr:VCBS repeat-containing protein [Candidatus Polarisedimenticolia bacterium]